MQKYTTFYRDSGYLPLTYSARRDFPHKINQFEVYIVWKLSYNDYLSEFPLLPSQTHLVKIY